MKLNLLTTAALLAMAGALMSQPAKAQYSGNPNDLIVSFTDGGSTDYQIDIGQASTYTGASSSINIVNVATDLTAVFGSNWDTNSSLVFSIEGVSSTGTNKYTVYVSDNSLTPYAAQGGSTLSTQNTDIPLLYTPGNDLGNPPTDGSAANSYKVSDASGYSFDSYASTGGSTYSANFEASVTSPTLYMDILNSTTRSAGTSSELSNGHFDITSGGEIQFTGASVPEPSTYALMILGGALLFVWQARRKSVSSF